MDTQALLHNLWSGPGLNRARFVHMGFAMREHVRLLDTVKGTCNATCNVTANHVGVTVGCPHTLAI